MPNLNMATKYAYLESAFQNLETISPFSHLCIMAHVSRLKFDAEYESGNQNALYRKCLSESGNYILPFLKSNIWHMFIILGQNLIQNLNLAIKYVYLESAFWNLEIILPFLNLCIWHIFLGQNLIPNLNMATKMPYLESILARIWKLFYGFSNYIYMAHICF